MKNRIKKIFELDNIIFILSIILLSYAFIPKGFENDIFFDVKTGESILKYGIDFKDHFSFIPNLIYLYHHWLYDIIIYFIFKKLSYLGTFFFFVSIFSCFSLIYYYICKKISSSKIISFIITLIVIVNIGYAIQTRVQSITYILFLLEILFLEKIYNGDKKYFIPLLLNAILIVNLHMPLWILSIVLFLPFFVEGFISYICDNYKKVRNFISKYAVIERPKSYKLLFFSFGAILLTGFLSPHGINPYLFFIKVMLSKGFSIIGIGELAKVELIDLTFGLFLIIIVFLGLYFRILKIKFRDLCMMLGLFVFMLMAFRNIVYFFYVSPLLILRSYYNSKNKKININIKFINKIKPYINIKILKTFVLVCIIAMMIGGIIVMDYKNYDFYINTDYPVNAVKFIKTNIDYKNKKIFNEFNYGSYLEYNDIPVFIDSRAEVYIKDFNGGVDVVSDYANVSKFKKYKEVFKKYDFDYAIVYKNDNIDTLLSLDSDFINIYDDDIFVVYEVKK